MTPEELKQLSDLELWSKVKQWKEEGMFLRIHSATSKVKDTSVFRKNRKNIARALTELNRRRHGLQSMAKDVG